VAEERRTWEPGNEVSEDELDSVRLLPYLVDGYLVARLLVAGPPIIGDKARWKFPKNRIICSDKISEFCSNMFGPRPAFAIFFKFCSDGPSGLQKRQFCSDRPIRPQKAAVSFGLSHQASKKCNFPSTLTNHPISTSHPASYCRSSDIRRVDGWYGQVLSEPLR
jgi:hypothetical protein